MSLFSRKPKNRQRRPSARKRTDLLDTPELKSAKPRRKPKSDDLVGQAYHLNAQIGAIENFLANKTAEQLLRERMRRDGLLPPPDRAGARRGGKNPNLSHSERRRYHAERSKSGIHFFLLFCLAIAIGWWLLFSGV
ncbi:MAG: hypothetical protein B9S36_07240 [Verrucomicrobiia bacterium Tous-C2TDCM]|nr:MAG: hypothetical protein B9S36_07240 [Verrucomicrobiae bacterium Tous-C2TDCM]